MPTTLYVREATVWEVLREGDRRAYITAESRDAAIQKALTYGQTIDRDVRVRVLNDAGKVTYIHYAATV